VTFFDGSMRQWLTDVGIPYDQRNALIVGIAMGFAVIPTIFSIAEDAVFNVPRHLTRVRWRWAPPPGRRWWGWCC
jgi:phosphate transport system permease protein